MDISKRYSLRIKFAVTVLSSVMIMVNGLSWLATLPVQPEKIYPSLGVAVRVTLWFSSYDPPDELTLPPKVAVTVKS